MYLQRRCGSESSPRLRPDFGRCNRRGPSCQPDSSDQAASALQIEELLRTTLAKLERQQSALTSGMSVSEPVPEVYNEARAAYGLSMHPSMSHSSAYQVAHAHPYATAQSMQRQHMQPAPHEMEYRAMYPGQGDMMQPGNSGPIPMIAIPSRKPTPKNMRPPSLAEQQHSMQSMQSMHLQHAHSGIAMHPQHMQQMPRHPSPAQAAALPAHMMPQYLPPGMPMHGHGMYGYAPQHPHQMHMPHDPAMAGMPAQYFMPVDASFKDSSSRPQVQASWLTCLLVYMCKCAAACFSTWRCQLARATAWSETLLVATHTRDTTTKECGDRPLVLQARNGRVLTQADIQNSLVGKQAELLWPDDGLWYLIKITAVNLMESTADIIYLTGETEAGLNLEDIAIKKEMRIIPG